MKRIHLLSAAAACAALAIAGCGGSDDNSGSTGSTGSAAPATTESTPATTETTPSSSGGGSELKISADPSGQLKFNTDALTAKAGKVTITMDNPSSVPHAVAVEGNGVDKDGNTVQQGGKSTVSVDLMPGKYEFYCPVDGHKDAGMKGDLTVK